MSTKNIVTIQKSDLSSFVKPMVVGAVIAFAVISLFVFGVDHPNPAWGKFWMIRPLIITPLAGAMGGAFYSHLNQLSSRGFNKTVAILLGMVVYIIGLWLGIVLGLAGTMWN
ncbi:potassium transporter KefB [Rufibacter latericius]|uniref:Potassium transporter KefB n=1 Tax=Rufibacter latericius TaxID=2487040 RepID=A0A3M9MFB5_9BACT|nr:potassium transporter KefB [Rufibacter latericius]RNI23553.1 potassium transporter KefB [Rufibacter latericius]